MSKWTHAMCWICWHYKYYDKLPTTVVNADKEMCCFCGLSTESGIYVRHDPNDPKLVCKGKHNNGY